jgi:hypothetical protein
MRVWLDRRVHLCGRAQVVLALLLLGLILEGLKVWTLP